MSDEKARRPRRHDPFEGETGDNELPDAEQIAGTDQPEDPGVVGTAEDWSGGASLDRTGGAGETASTPGGLDGPSTGQGGG